MLVIIEAKGGSASLSRVARAPLKKCDSGSVTLESLILNTKNCYRTCSTDTGPFYNTSQTILDISWLLVPSSYP